MPPVVPPVAEKIVSELLCKPPHPTGQHSIAVAPPSLLAIGCLIEEVYKFGFPGTYSSYKREP